MDLRCRWCGEPWDVFEITDSASLLKVQPKRAHELFRKFGCGFFDTVWSAFPRVKDMEPCAGTNDDPMLMVYTELADLMGDDVDGTAALAEDFGLI